jgi:hypothetical protein
MIVPGIRMILVELPVFPAQIAVVRSMFAGLPAAFLISSLMSSGMPICYAVMIAVVGTVIALMLVAITVIVILMGECGKDRQGEKQRSCKQSLLHSSLTY